MNFKITLFAIVVSCFFIFACGGEEEGMEATCSDGIQNGLESGVDCGGNCAPCASLPELMLGQWRISSWTEGSTNFLDFIGQNTFLEFSLNREMEQFRALDNGTTSLSSQIYSLVGDNSIEFLSDGSSLTVECSFSNNSQTLTMEGDRFGSAVKIVLTKITTDLCAGVTCMNGDCYYGYCHCNAEYTGEDCDQIVFPTFFKFYDFSIRVYPYESGADDCIPAQSTGFDCDHADAYIQIKHKDSGNIIYHTAMHPYVDGCTPCQWTGDIRLVSDAAYEIIFLDNDSEFNTPDEIRAIGEIVVSRDFTRSVLFSPYDPIIQSPGDFSHTNPKSFVFWADKFGSSSASATCDMVFTSYEWVE